MGYCFPPRPSSPDTGKSGPEYKQDRFVSGGWLFGRLAPQVRHEAHLRTKYEDDPEWLEAILLKCQSVERENKGNIDPELFILFYLGVFLASL